MTDELKQSEKTSPKWYKTWWGILIIIGLWPFSLSYYFWKQKINIYQKVGAIVLVWIVYFLLISSFKSNSNNKLKNREVSTIAPTVVLSPVPTVKEERSVEEIRKSISEEIEKLKEEESKDQLSADEVSPTVSQKIRPQIEVTSVIVKDIGKKYRYFFDIRNKGKSPFAGSVTISFYILGRELEVGAFNTDELNGGQLEPGLGMSRYIDMNTGPEEVHGEFGISKFSYKVFVEGEELGAGQGNITSKLE